MAVTLSALTKYTDQLSHKLIIESVLKGNTAQYVMVQPNVKYKEALNISTSTLAPAAGGCGAFNASGNGISLSQREIEVAKFKVEDYICNDSLEDYWVGLKLNGSYSENGPAELMDAFLADKVNKIQDNIEQSFWKATSTGTFSTSYTIGTGVFSIIEETSASASVVIGSTSSGALTAANAITVADEMIDRIPTDITDSTSLLFRMSHANFRTLSRALRTTYGFDATAGYADTGNENRDGAFMFYYPGTNILVMAVAGYRGTNKLMITTKENIYMGVDVEDEATNNFKVWFDDNSQELRFRAKWKLGAQIAYPQYVVYRK